MIDSRITKGRVYCAIVFVVLSVILCERIFERYPTIRESTEAFMSNSSITTAEAERVLILYVWANIDAQSLGNLEFFIRYGVHTSQPADYYFILQKVHKLTIDESRLPRLPPNAHYMQHENECFDFGTFGWFLASKLVDTSVYKYFIFMNSSVRGPFLVSPLVNRIGWWFTIFTERLTEEIKLVGPTISCERKPHLQSYLLATDQVGFALLTSSHSGVFSCHRSYLDAIGNGEIASSQLLLRAKYQIASLQTKYQGWDFNKPENQRCNDAVSPIHRDNVVDGLSHDPYELVFVKFKGKPPFDTALMRRAFVYQKWLEQRPKK